MRVRSRTVWTSRNEPLRWRRTYGEPSRAPLEAIAALGRMGAESAAALTHRTVAGRPVHEGFRAVDYRTFEALTAMA